MNALGSTLVGEFIRAVNDMACRTDQRSGGAQTSSTTYITAGGYHAQEADLLKSYGL